MRKTDQDWRERNRETYNEGVNAWRKRNPDSVRDYNFRRKYGITLIDYNEMLVAQGGCCAVCERTDTGNSKHPHFAVDHSHLTGAVRGLLCHHCNIALGAVKDNPSLLRELADYLDRHVREVIDAGNSTQEANGQQTATRTES